MFDEDELVPLSALSQIVYCERRCALIHVEGMWDENVFTSEGRVLHGRTHEPDVEVRGDLRVVRGLLFRSLRLGLSGKADVVEFHRLSPDGGPNNAQTQVLRGVALPDAPGFWVPFPVEYKRGKLRTEECYRVQLCAQALCLEEMLNVAVPSGALYYAKSKRRLDVSFDSALRSNTERLAARLHELVRERKTPAAIYDKRCRNCSLLPLCMPQAVSGPSARRYLARAIEQAEEEPA